MGYNKNKIRKNFSRDGGFQGGESRVLPLEASTGSAWRSIYYGKQFSPFTAEIAEAERKLLKTITFLC